MKSKRKNFRKIPILTQQRVESLNEESFIVACAKRIPETDIVTNQYSHIGLAIINNELQFPSEQLLLPEVGRFSKINREGKSIIRKDLPKIKKEYSFEAPNFGDKSKGWHTVEMERQVYQREQFPPKNKQLTIHLLTEEQTEERAFILKFAITETIDKGNPLIFQNSIHNDLFFNLNLLQESVGAADIFKSTATYQEFLESISVSWEFLPPGNREQVVNRILSNFRHPNEETRERVLHRYNLLTNLNPIGFIHGIGEFRRYFGAKFSDNLVVFENLEPGNAIYVMYENWASLSRLSRTELLENPHLGYTRITHLPGWESRLISLVERNRLTTAA